MSNQRRNNLERVRRVRAARRGVTRRRFLGGAGATLMLPFFESLGGAGARAARAAESTTPLRHLYFYVPNGIHMPLWTPEGTGADFTLPRILEPLERHRDDILVISGLANRPAEPEGAGDHAAGTGSFLTATHVRKTEGEDIENDVSVDQVAASAVGGETRLPSIQLGSEGGASVGGCDSGYSCAYSRNISWAGPQTPLPKMVSPQLIFDRFFAGFDPSATEEEIARRRQDRISVIDYALDEASSLRVQLGHSDALKLDEYLTGVRELERQIEDSADARACEPPLYPPVELAFQDHVRTMIDLIVLAFQCDLTRIASYMLANAGSSIQYSFLGVTGGHHDISHHQNNPDNFEKLTVIDRWEIEQLAYLLDRLSDIEEPDGTSLLDNTMIFFSSEIADGNRHSHVDLPVLIAGNAQGQIATGRHLAFEGEQPIANLFISLLGTLGVEADSFGDNGSGPLEGLS